MGEAKRRQQARGDWPVADSYRGDVNLHILAPSPQINGARICELTGDDVVPITSEISLRAFRAEAGERSFVVGFCVGDGECFSPIGIAVIERLAIEAPGVPLHVVPIQHADIAWDIVLRHLRTFKGEALLFAFPNSEVYDAGTAPVSYARYVRQFDHNGNDLGKLTNAQLKKIQENKAKFQNQPSPPRFYPSTGMTREDCPWVFRIVTPVGKVIRTAVWDGRRDYAHELPKDIVRWVGGDRVAVVQVNSPVGVNRRSSLSLTHTLSGEFDGVVHWARDTETFQSILSSFIRLDLDSVSPPDLPEDWSPEVVFLLANNDASE